MNEKQTKKTLELFNQRQCRNQHMKENSKKKPTKKTFIKYLNEI